GEWSIPAGHCEKGPRSGDGRRAIQRNLEVAGKLQPGASHVARCAHSVAQYHLLSENYRAASFAHGCATVNSTAASDLLTWLESQLAEAEQSHEKVWFMLHIPPGIDGWATTHPYDRTSAGTSGSAPSRAKSVVALWGPEWNARF